MFALAGPGLGQSVRRELGSPHQQMMGGTIRSALWGRGDTEEVKPTTCSHGAGMGQAGSGGTRGGWPEGNPRRPPAPLPGSLSHKRGRRAGRAAGSTSPHGKGTGQGRLPVSPPPPAGPAPALGSLRPQRPWERAPAAPGKGCGDGGAGEGRSEPPCLRKLRALRRTRTGPKPVTCPGLRVLR